MNRRNFLKTGTALGAGPAAGGAAPGDRAGVAIIGCGGMGRMDLTDFGRQPDVEIRAVCDVWRQNADKAREMAGGKPDVYGDYRRVLERNFFTDLRPTEASSPGPQSPEQPEPSTMPGHDGIRLHNDKGISPSGPETAEDNPEQPVKAPYSASRLFPFEHDELLAKRRDLQTQTVPGDDECAAIGEHRDDERYHHSNGT